MNLTEEEIAMVLRKREEAGERDKRAEAMRRQNEEAAARRPEQLRVIEEVERMLEAAGIEIVGYEGYSFIDVKTQRELR